MKLTSIIAIYTLFWVMSAFLVMPFGLRTRDEWTDVSEPHEGGQAHPRVPGQADSAPVNFQPRKVAARATVLAAVLFGLFYANYLNGWVGIEDLDITRL